MDALLIGAGGLGTAVLWALADVPALRLTVADPDQVALSNLHRQILYRVEDVGAFKVDILQQRVAPLSLETLKQRLDTPERIIQAAGSSRVIVDGSDNFRTRFAANDAALESGIALVHGAVTGWRGQVMTILPGQSACLRCLFDGPPPDGEIGACQREGVVGSVVAEIGWWMAMEAWRILQGVPPVCAGRILTIDAHNGIRRPVAVRRRGNCPGCGR